MWVFTPGAFVSIVAHREQPGLFLVRARRREDLERFCGLTAGAASNITEADDRDYRFRIVLPRERVQALMAEQVESIDYDNFKAHPLNAARSGMLHTVWALVRDWATVRGR